jgi:hypothetical protein
VTRITGLCVLWTFWLAAYRERLTHSVGSRKREREWRAKKPFYKRTDEALRFDEVGGLLLSSEKQ